MQHHTIRYDSGYLTCSKKHRFYHKQIHSVDELKRRLIDVCCGLERSIFDEAIDQWRGRLCSSRTVHQHTAPRTCNSWTAASRNAKLSWALRIRRTRTLCIRRTQCRHVTIGTPMVIFAVLTVFWLFLTIGTLLVHWYIATVLVDMWQLVHQWSFLLFWLSFDCFWRLVQSKQQKWPLVYQLSHVYT